MASRRGVYIPCGLGAAERVSCAAAAGSGPVEPALPAHPGFNPRGATMSRVLSTAASLVVLCAPPGLAHHSPQTEPNHTQTFTDTVAYGQSVTHTVTLGAVG